MFLMPAFATASGLLVLAGARKLSAPVSLQPALRALGAPPRPALARALGAGEIALGALALLRPGMAVAAGCAAAYALFALAQWRLGSSGDADCGCFGSAPGSPAPPGGGGRVAMNLLACALCTAAALNPPPGLDWLLARAPGIGLALALGIGGSIYGAYLCFTALPGAWSAYAGGRR